MMIFQLVYWWCSYLFDLILALRVCVVWFDCGSIYVMQWCWIEYKCFGMWVYYGCTDFLSLTCLIRLYLCKCKSACLCIWCFCCCTNFFGSWWCYIVWWMLWKLIPCAWWSYMLGSSNWEQPILGFYLHILPRKGDIHLSWKYGEACKGLWWP